MGLWLVANCSSTLRVEHLPEEVQQDAQSIIKCYLPLSQNATLSSDHDKTSDRETWWICPTVVTYQVRPGYLCTNFAMDSHSGLAYTWLTVEVPDDMDPLLSWSDILHYLPITVFIVAKQLYEWSHLEYEEKTTRNKRRRLGKVTNGMHLLQQQFESRSLAAVRPRVHSPTSSSSLLLAPSNTWHPLLSLVPVSETMAAFLMDNSSSRYHWRTWAEFITTIRPQRLSFRLQPGLGNPWASTATALEMIRNQLNTMAWYQVWHTSKIDCRRGHLLPKRKSKEGNAIIMPKVEFHNQKETNIDRLAWIARPSTLLHALRGNTLHNLQAYGVYSYVVSQPYMGSMITVKPVITHLPSCDLSLTRVEEDGEEIVLLLLANLHEYRFLYASLAGLVKQFACTESPQGEPFSGPKKVARGGAH